MKTVREGHDPYTKQEKRQMKKLCRKILGLKPVYEGHREFTDDGQAFFDLSVFSLWIAGIKLGWFFTWRGKLYAYVIGAPLVEDAYFISETREVRNKQDLTHLLENHGFGLGYGKMPYGWTPTNSTEGA